MLIRLIVPVVFAYGMAVAATPADATIVNLGADLGFTYNGGGSDPAPVAGQHINFMGSVPTLSLAAGTYQITNATGLAGANPDYTAWSYNVGTSSWAWAFVVADSAGTVIDYQQAGSGNDKASVAALPGVTNFHSTFTLAAATDVAFTLRDYYLNDNAGGLALNVQPVVQGVPEPAEWALLICGFAGAGAMLRRHRAPRVHFS